MNSLFLIADDSEYKRTFLLDLLKTSQFSATPVTAATTEEAITLIGEAKDIVGGFIDYEIPSENGPEIIRVLHEKFPQAHIALVTTADGGHFKREAKEAGAEAFVTMSYGEDLARERLSELLEEWKRTQ